MSTRIYLTYYGMEGSGRTVTEAKRDAGAKIESAVKGDYSPEVFTHRGNAILVYREPLGWRSRVIADADTGIRAGTVHGNSGSGVREEVIREVLEHLAQLGWKPEDGTDAPEFLKDRASIGEFKSWAEFQLRYREARARGLSDNDAHSFAGRNPCRPELWTAVA